MVTINKLGTMKKETEELISKFDSIIQAAVESDHSDIPADVPKEAKKIVVDSDPALSWNINEFIDAWHKGKLYPVERLDRAVLNMMDIKLQLYYLRSDLSIYNLLIKKGYDHKAPDKTPALFLRWLSLNQSQIVKSRILWERIMNLIFWIETGVVLGDLKKAKNRFFQFVKSENRWTFLEPYEKLIEDYDANYRTPEVHKASVLRNAITRDKEINLNELISLSNAALNVIYENMISIISGGKAYAFSKYHRATDGMAIDPKYLE
jgi:hypothetical protein